MPDETQTPPQDEPIVLESAPDDQQDAASAAAPPETSAAAPEEQPPPQDKKPGFFKRLSRRLNIYFLLFILILVAAGSIVLVAYLQSRHAAQPTNTIKTQDLTQSTLQKIANSDATVGNNQSVLNVQSSAVFAGQVLIRKDLQVAGNLNIGGTVALNNITVSGASQFGQMTVNKNLAVGGDTAIQGATTISKSLQVGGNGTFKGSLSAPQIATSGLQLNGDLVLSHHITTSGGTPSQSNGSALGSGGTASVSGTDTAGSVSVNTGNSPAAGCFVTIGFTAKYGSTPHVLITPVGSAAGSLNYYVNRSTSSFSICDASVPPSGSSFTFDYFVIN